MSRPTPSETKLLICAWHRFTLWRPPATLVESLRRRWPDMNVVHLPDYAGMDEELSDTDVFVGFSLRPEQFARARKLKWIHCTAAGVGQLMYPELRASGVMVTNASGIHSIPMAEHIIGTLVALARNFPAAMRHQLAGRWAQQEMWDSPLRPRELAGQVLLIVGLGAIGRELAQRVKPLGMKVWGVTRSGNALPDLADRVLPVSHLEEALPEADFVVLAAPQTPETQHLIGARQLAAMKPTAFLINVARGSLVDEAALTQALERRAIAGAALDVAAEEPLPPGSPLWRLDKVFITPHISAVSDRLWERQERLLIENLERWFSGRESVNRVDLKRGY